MNRHTWIVTLTVLSLIISACSKEDPAPVAASPVVAETTTDTAETTTEEGTTETTESVVVVEESAAEAEPVDQKIVLAQTGEVATTQSWKFREGSNFTRMIPTQPTVGGADKIEVAEIFMYTCPHCYDLEAYINPWADSKDPGVRFVRIPAIFNQTAQLHAQLYYTEVFLAQSGKLTDPKAFRNMVFEELHRKGNPLNSESMIRRLFTRVGVSEDDFNRTWGSFEVNQALRKAADLSRRYGVASVPMIVVNGKYRTDAGSAGSYPKLIELIDELTVREGLR